MEPTTEREEILAELRDLGVDLSGVSDQTSNEILAGMLAQLQPLIARPTTKYNDIAQMIHDEVREAVHRAFAEQEERILRMSREFKVRHHHRRSPEEWAEQILEEFAKEFGLIQTPEAVTFLAVRVRQILTE